ncbi:MAG: hypothetical protein M1814_001887 [Vezdaea aestivalis]|nr:MAG: hypothetical protein M1814_001887 [Vezdaea aestivalis]
MPMNPEREKILPSIMQCCVCRRSPNSRLSFKCATCARNDVYYPRLELISTLVQKEHITAEVDKIINSDQEWQGQKRTSHARQNLKQASYSLRLLESHKATVDEEMRGINEEIDRLQQQVEQRGATIKAQKTSNNRRKSEIDSAKAALVEQEGPLDESIQSNTRRAERRWTHVHDRSIISRSFLCREAASLYGLRQRRTKRSDGSIKEAYRLGGVPLTDLRELNNNSPSKITANLNNVANLLALTSHYLALRLPAELTLPHRDYPLATILPPAASYQSRSRSFSAVNPSPSVNNDTAARPLARPRPLYVDKTLPALAKDDPAAYSFFIEGVTYLAWDVAWLCRTQGLDVGSTGWEDICSMGRNLWRLLVSQAGVQSHSGATKDTTAQSTLPGLGQLSHGSSYSFLGAVQGAQFMKSWPLQSPMKLVDQVKARLLNDMAGAEWEVLDEREWEETRDETGGGETLVNGPPDGAIRVSDESTQNGVTDSSKDLDTSEQRPTDKSKGWTKLKSRSES